MNNRSMLAGIRVLEISHAIAGPTTAQVLADYGAEVIKIERPGSGDIFRDVPGMGPSMFLAVNRGKKSVGIDLKKREGVKLFYDLVKVSDVIIQNLGPRIAERLGITFRRIERVNTRAIYCCIESFGKGPYENIPAFDPVLQASSGIMSTTGIPPDKYVRAGISVVDTSAGLHAVSGILALLFRRNVTRRGGELNVSLYDAASYFMSYWITMFGFSKKDTTPLGATHIFGAPYNLFKTKDGFVYIAITGDKTWDSFCRSLGFVDLLRTDAYATNVDRVKRKQILETIVSKRVRKFTTGQVVKRLMRSGVPFAKLNTVKSLLRDSHFVAADTLKQYAYSGKKFQTVVNPTKIDGSRPYARASPPKLGSNTISVLRTLLHMNAVELDSLKKRHVIST